MKVSEIKGKAAIECLGDILDPVCSILADDDIKNAYRSKVPQIKLVGMILKTHAEEVQTILAYLDGADPETYECNILTLPAKVMEVLNDEDFTALFSSVAPDEGGISSGDATMNGQTK